jgi:uncharacterized protein (DUF924 family)
MTAIPAGARTVLDFWFGAPGTPGYGESRIEWFRKSAEFDAQVQRELGPSIDAALAGGLQDWRDAPESALARILLLDQCTRNVYRDTAKAFAGDAQALRAAREMVASDADQQLPPLQRAFVYLPFEHAEDLAMQQQSVALYTRLVEEAPSLADMLDYAQRHLDIVARFGRFPHRNAQLGRASTPQEVAFLEQPGSRF